MKNKKHITLTGRIKIEAGIEKGQSIKAIAHSVPTNVSSVYREIKRNSRKIKNASLKCIHRKECLKKYSTSLNCIDCKNYIEEKCKRISRFPFVCNCCEKRGGCTYTRYFYRAQEADEKAERRLVDSRVGIRITKECFNAIDEIISPLIINKQSLNHILSTHDEIPVSERTLRNWINYGYTHAKTIDLPRTVRFKVSKQYNYRNQKTSSILKDRTYIDYKRYIKEHPELMISQFDTVLGLKTDHKRILTIHFPSIHFQFGFLLRSGEPEELNSTLISLRKKIGSTQWKKIFPIMLTDNGIEFNDFYHLEADENGEMLSRVFYTDPYRSGQKGACERNHELYRYIQPKKKSIEYLTQDILNTYFSNINCYYRKSLAGVRPYDLAKGIFGEKFLDVIGIREIKPDDVTFVKNKLINK